VKFDVFGRRAMLVIVESTNIKQRCTDHGLQMPGQTRIRKCRADDLPTRRQFDTTLGQQRVQRLSMKVAA